MLPLPLHTMRETLFPPAPRAPAASALRSQRARPSWHACVGGTTSAGSSAAPGTPVRARHATNQRPCCTGATLCVATRLGQRVGARGGRKRREQRTSALAADCAQRARVRAHEPAAAAGQPEALRRAQRRALTARRHGRATRVASARAARALAAGTNPTPEVPPTTRGELRGGPSPRRSCLEAAARQAAGARPASSAALRCAAREALWRTRQESLVTGRAGAASSLRGASASVRPRAMRRQALAAAAAAALALALLPPLPPARAARQAAARPPGGALAGRRNGVCWTPQVRPHKRPPRALVPRAALFHHRRRPATIVARSRAGVWVRDGLRAAAERPR